MRLFTGLSRGPSCVLLVVAAACAGGDSTPEASTVATRDSAGVRIVQNPGGPVDTLRVGPPLLTIGQEGDARYEFSRLAYVDGRADGGVVVVDGVSAEIRFFDAAGTHERSVGGQGQGPGEFLFVTGAQMLPGDTLAVFDGRNRRVTFVAPDGTMDRFTSWLAKVGEMDAGADACLFPGLVSLFGDRGERLALRGWACVTAHGREGPNNYAHSISIWDPASDETTPVARVPYLDVWERVGTEIRDRFPMHRFRVGSIPVGWSDGIAVASYRQNEILLYGQDGSLRMVVRDATPLRPVTSAVQDAWSAAHEEAFVALFEGVPFPDSLPAFARAVVGDGQVWALHYDIPGTVGEHWGVYDLTDGVRKSVVAFPPGFQLRSVRDGRVYGFSTDDFGIERPQVYEVPPWPV